MTPCDHVTDELAELIAGDRAAIARHAEHLAGCDACRDARHDAQQLAELIGGAGDDHALVDDLVARVLAAVDRDTAQPAARAATLRGLAVPEPPELDAAHAATASLAVPTPGLVAPAQAATASRAVATPDGLDAAAHAATTSLAVPTPGLVASADAAAPAALGAEMLAAQATGAPDVPAAQPTPLRRRPRRVWLALGAGAALAAGIAGLVVRSPDEPAPRLAVIDPGPLGTLAKLERAAAGNGDGVTIRVGDSWQPLRRDAQIPAGAELRTDDRTRAALALADGTQLVLDHHTAIAFGRHDAHSIALTAGRLAASLSPASAAMTSTGASPTGAASTGAPARLARPPATAPAGNGAGSAAARATTITTPRGRIEASGDGRFVVTATDALTSLQVTRGAATLVNARGEHDDVRAGEEGLIERGALAVSAAPGLVHDAAWSELAAPTAAGPDEITAGLGALRAYKPGESRDRDWNLALARHDVKVRVVGPVARTEIAETFRNDSATTLEGVYQFPLPSDAQIDSLALDVAGGFVDGAFIDKERGQKIWRGVIDKATPRTAARPTQELIWVEGRWRDPALLDWKRGGRFELRVYPIPAHGARTIKLAYTQIVTPRGSWRQYSYPLPHSRDGSTVADQFTVDVELRGAEPGLVRTAGYDLVPDPARRAVNALTLTQAGFVPRGDLVIDYRATDGDAELRGWTFAGGAAAAPDDKLATKQHVGIDPKVVAAQRVVASDLRPTAVLALHPRLPRWRDGRPRDYVIVVDGSQSMVGERFTRATELATAVVAQLDRRDRFGVLVCDSECRGMDAASATGVAPHELRTPSLRAAEAVRAWLAAQQPAGASDVVAALRAAGAGLDAAADREPWILYLGDGFASTGFRRVADVEQAVAASFSAAGSRTRIAAIGIGSDADAAVLAAAARGGGGSYLAWVPGQRATTAAAAVLETTLGAALEGAVVELPAGLADVAPTALPTVRAGEEVLLAARMTGDVAGDVVVRGRVAGQPFEQRYPLKLAVSTAAGNGFVPRLWARLAIDQLERTGTADDRTRIVALSQGYGVMSRETSLLVLESQAMFDAFGVDRGRPAARWTGEDALDEVATTGTLAVERDEAIATASIAAGKGDTAGRSGVAAADNPYDDDRPTRAKAIHLSREDLEDPLGAPHKKAPAPSTPRAMRAAKDVGPGPGWIQLRRTWIRVPSVTEYDAVHPSIIKAIADAEAALAASPDSREKHRALVQALSYAGELDRARDVARRWLERDQLDPQALGYLADLLGRDGQRDLALRTLAGLVDLDPDRVALHERLAQAYDLAGRRAQACGHRIALAALQPRVAAANAGALRCLRELGRERDAALVLAALPDDAFRATVEKAALATPLAPPITGELVVKARWDADADLDVTLVTPEGARVSWLGGRTDLVASDATSSEREQLAVKSLRRGNYLVEIDRATTAANAAPIHGTLDITALGAHRSIPFELTGAHAVVGRVSVRLEQQFEDLDGSRVRLYDGPDRRIIRDRE